MGESTGQMSQTAIEPGEVSVEFRHDVAERLIKYGRMVVARGYIHNSLGNIAIRVPHPAFPCGVAYAKHAGVSLEEMELEHVVITDIPTDRLLHGSVPTSVGHKLNREILRLRPDVNAVIHVHHDETIAHFAAGRLEEVKAVSLEYPYVMAKPAHVVPSHLDVEADVEPIKDFIQDTNSLVMVRHGITTLGRNVSEAYHRLNTLTSEVRRIVTTELLAAARGTEGDFLTDEEVRWMYERAEDVIYPEGSAVFGEDL
jgi:ribulose-5-phosphate 4-epimerase/fuculose-1-phosphate aldolase